MLLTTFITSVLLIAPDGANAIAPNLVEDESGAWMTWIEPVDAERNITALKCAKFDGERQAWGDAHLVVQGNNFFANWADFPELGIAKDGTLFVTWPQQSGPGTYAYDIAVARSDDDGVTWSLMGTLNDDRVLGEHGFVSLVPEGENCVRAFWLDGRAMSGDGHMGEGGGDMQLRTAIINDKVQKSELLDDRVCECCGTDAVLVDGKPVVVYRDRSEDEVRDIVITGPAKIARVIHADNWNIAGCPVNGPSVDANDSTIAIAWYTAPESKTAIYVAFSETPIKISNSILGRVDVAVIAKDTAAVTWLEPNGETASVMLATIHADGTIENKKEVAQVSASRSSGFPRIAKVSGGILLAWTDLDRLKGIFTKFYAD
ncbi:MAG: hypothetical protein CMJ26_02845 [Phycisphaerae bacterium]|nr:hypothetical protein [Phycisphaerae bacterium]